MKNKHLFLSALITTLILAACTGQTPAGTEKTDATDSSQEESIGNPFEDFDSLEEACEAAGFGMVIPESIEGYSRRTIQAIPDELVQVFFEESDGKSETRSADSGDSPKEILIRKAKGADDISGDYNEYKIEKTIVIGENEVTLRGPKKNNFCTATWTKDDFSFAIDAAQGLRESEMKQLIILIM